MNPTLVRSYFVATVACLIPLFAAPADAAGQPMPWDMMIRAEIDAASGGVLLVEQVEQVGPRAWLRTDFRERSLQLTDRRMRGRQTVRPERGAKGEEPRLAGVATGSDGRVIVADRANEELVFYRLRGNRLDEGVRVSLDYRPVGLCRMGDRLYLLDAGVR